MTPCAISSSHGFTTGFALLVMWSQQVFQERPTAGFTVAIVCIAVGFIIGPSLFGVLATHVGRPTALLGLLYTIVLMFSMQGDKIVVRFEQGRVRSATSALTFDRPFRVTHAQGRNFNVVISDEDGIEVESRCQWDDGGRILFETITAPWVGRGVLEREGPAMASPVPDA